MFFKRLTFQSHTLLLPGLLTGLAIIAALFPEFVANVLIYDRDMITQGQLWRLLSGHFFHTNVNHLLLNLAAVALLWLLHNQYYSIRFSLIVLMVSLLFTSLGLFYFVPDLIWYVGLSGILHGLFFCGAIEDIRSGEKTGYLLLIGLVVKIGYEQIYGADQQIIDLIEANVAIDAHLWGAVSGILASIFLTFWRKKTPTI